MLMTRNIDVWVFSGRDWFLRDPIGPYVGREEHTIEFSPTVVEDFELSLDIADKIVGISNDFKVLAKLEQGACKALADRAADLVTGSNRDDGFADAIQRIIIGGDRSSVKVQISRPGNGS